MAVIAAGGQANQSPSCATAANAAVSYLAHSANRAKGAVETAMDGANSFKKTNRLTFPADQPLCLLALASPHVVPALVPGQSSRQAKFSCR